jgi:maleylpyruvate isomerase
MTRLHDVHLTLPWLREGTQYFAAAVRNLTDAQFAEPSGLPGWTRAHLVGHVARNAEALTRLATWARTGEPNPMYADAEQRAREIEESAQLPPARLRSELIDTASALDAALSRLTEEEWGAQVRSATGRMIPASEIPWLRVREVWLHAADFDGKAMLDDVPGDVLDLLLDDVSAALSAKPGCPAVLLSPVDRERNWHLGGDESGAGVPVLRASAAVTVAWLTGRAEPVGLAEGLPRPPRWL